MRDTTGRAAAPTARRRNVRRNRLVRGGDMVFAATLYSSWPIQRADAGHPTSIRHRSIAEDPPRDPRVALISAILGERLLVPELVRRRPVRQLEQQRGADVVGGVSRADRSAKDEARAVRGEV